MAAFLDVLRNIRPTGTRRRAGTSCENRAARLLEQQKLHPERTAGSNAATNSLSRCENCPVARPEHAAEEFIPVSTKNATERALGRSCSSCVDVSFFAGHPHEMPSTAGDAFPGSAAPPEQEAGSPFPTGSRSRIAKSAPTDSRG